MSEEDEALLGAIAALRTWYQRAYAEGDALWTFAGHDAGGPDWNGWAADAERQLDPARKPPYADAASVPNIEPPLTYAAVEEFGSVAAARAQWEAVRGRLRRLLDVGAALGLIEGLKVKPAVLVVPPDGLTLEQAGARFRDLGAAYPQYATEFVRDGGLPQAVADEAASRARRDYERLLEPARALVRAQAWAGRRGDSGTVAGGARVAERPQGVGRLARPGPRPGALGRRLRARTRCGASRLSG